MWAMWFKDVCVVQIQLLLDNFEKRILSSFESISDEAEKVQQEAWERFEKSAGPDSDPSSGAEWALQEGIVHYMNLEDLRQGLLNVSATFCYHLFEQQLFYFHRKELLKQYEENDHDLFKHKEIKKRLAEHAIDIEGFRSWSKVDELRLVANVVKHADGDSAKKLRELRPKMFTRPDLREDEVMNPILSCPLPVFQPLFGHDFYVTIEDLRAYAGAAIDFWTEMAGLLEGQPQNQEKV